MKFLRRYHLLVSKWVYSSHGLFIQQFTNKKRSCCNCVIVLLNIQIFIIKVTENSWFMATLIAQSIKISQGTGYSNSPKRKSQCKLMTIFKLYYICFEDMRQEKGSCFISQFFWNNSWMKGQCNWEDAKPVDCVLPTIFHWASPQQD